PRLDPQTLQVTRTRARTGRGTVKATTCSSSTFVSLPSPQAGHLK
uniref:Uncharacterized protein n=1 Tax=Aegilops tauschii subsp. strangulata TaxID=200361 RepID=A0A453DAE9_AEGTS